MSGLDESAAGKVMGYGERAWREESQAIEEWLNTI
jgi:hypothetical protein